MAPSWLDTFAGRRVIVEVPASTANLGAGYDCLGMALALVNRVELEVRPAAGGLRLVGPDHDSPDHDSPDHGELDDDGLDRRGPGRVDPGRRGPGHPLPDRVRLTVEGEGQGEIEPGADNRFVRGLEAALRLARAGEPGDIAWHVSMHNRIPLSRGLGSSAAATIAGLVAGNALLGGSLDNGDLLRLATEIEGHPDNAAAALLGGVVVTAAVDGRVEAIRFDVPPGLRCILFIPDRRLSTAAMRSALPRQVPLADAVANLGRVALGVAGLATGRADVLRLLTVDRLHEPYRAEVYPELPELVAAARAAGALGACLSGSGSSVVAFTDDVAEIPPIEGALAAAAVRCGLAGRTSVESPRNQGAVVLA